MNKTDEFNIQAQLKDLRRWNKGGGHSMEILHYELMLEEIDNLRALNEKLAESLSVTTALLSDAIIRDSAKQLQAYALVIANWLLLADLPQPVPPAPRDEANATG